MTIIAALTQHVCSKRNLLRPISGPALVIALCLVGAGCTQSAATATSGPTQATSQFDSEGAETRTDIEPIAKRWTFVQTELVVWMAGPATDPRVPGPNASWLQAVITTTPAEIERLQSEYSPAAADPPVLVDGLAADLPPGPGLHSPELDAGASAEHPTQVWVYPETNQVVLSSIIE